MNDFVFFLKLFGLTIVMVLLMQIQVGEQTIETHAMGWVQTSILVHPLNSVAHGGAKLVRDISHSVHGAIERNTTAKHKKEQEKEQEKKGKSPFRWKFL